MTLQQPSVTAILDLRRRSRAARARVHAPIRPAPPIRARTPAVRQFACASNRSWRCVTRLRSCSASPMPPKTLSRPRWPARRSACLPSCAIWCGAREAGRRARIGRTARIRRRKAGRSETCSPGTSPMRPKSCVWRKYAFSEEELKPYFPLPAVIEGLFTIVARVFGVRLRAREGVDVWHADVRYYDVRRCRRQRRRRLLRRPLHPHRQARRRLDGRLPVALRRWRRGTHTAGRLSDCNFPPPTNGSPSLLTHDDVVTLFHELGHCLHHLLTQVDCPRGRHRRRRMGRGRTAQPVHGELRLAARGARDCSRGHWQTGAHCRTLSSSACWPRGTSMPACSCCASSSSPCSISACICEYDAGARCAHAGLLRRGAPRGGSAAAARLEPLAHGFSHIFSGGYAAGYYSYLWAEVLAADALARSRKQAFSTAPPATRFVAACSLSAARARR